MSQQFLQDASSSKYKIVEPAKHPMEPFKPNRRKIVLIGFVLGMVLGGAAVVVAELLDNSLKRVEDVEAYLGLPVLGITPRADFLKRVR